MKLLWKKSLTVLTVSALSISLLAGCGSKANSTGNESSDKQGPVTIEWLAYNSYGQPEQGAEIVKTVEEKFNAKFNFWYIDNNKWDDNLNVRLAAGEMPDVLKIPNRNNIQNYVKQGLLAELSMETLEKYAPNYVKMINENYPEAWKSVMHDSKIYAIPTTNGDSNYPTTVIWRQDWLDNVGITKIPETITEFEDALYKFRNNDPDKNNKKDTYGLSDFAIPMIMGAFGYPGIATVKGAAKGTIAETIPMTTKEDKLVFASIQPEMKDALALLQKWYKDGIIDPEFITSENTTGYWADSQALYNNRIGLTGNAMFYHWRNEKDPSDPNDQGGGQYANFKMAQPNGELVFGKPMVGPNGASGTRMWDTTNSPMGITTEAAKDPKKVETILTMLDATVTDFSYWRSIFYGIEGIDWNEGANGKVNTLHPGEKAADQNKRGAQVFQLGVYPDDFFHQASPFLYSFADATKIQGYPTPFVPSTEAYNKYAQALTKLAGETYLRIITNELSVDAFDDYVAKFRSSGGDEIEKAVNDALSQLTGQE